MDQILKRMQQLRVRPSEFVITAFLDIYLSTSPIHSPSRTPLSAAFHSKIASRAATPGGVARHHRTDSADHQPGVAGYTNVLPGMAPALQALLQLAMANSLHRGHSLERLRIRQTVDRHAPGLLGRVLLDLMHTTNPTV
jgi:hypothetical protein